jgi:hypothetical protein
MHANQPIRSGLSIDGREWIRLWFQRVIVVSALVVGSTAVVVAPAAAASAPSLSDFVLRPASNQAQLTDRVKQLDAVLPKTGVQDLLADASRTGTRTTANGATCNPDAVDTRERNLATVFSFCFDAADSGTNGGTVEWTPQGITTVADAQDDKLWGTAEPIIVGWYNASADDKGVRISFINPHSSKYQHVLLVYPTINSAGNASYMSVRNQQDADGTSLHAGGLTWYGNYLYVADTRRGFRVFDMRYIFDLKAAGAQGDTSDKNQIGRHDGVFYAHAYRYVMPQVAAYTSNGGQVTDVTTCTAGGSPHFSFVGLDRTGTDHLNTGEYCNGTTGDLAGRVASWPLNGANGTPLLAADGLWRADKAFRLPVPNVQGAVSHGGTWYLNRSHGPDVPEQNDNGDLLKTAAPSGSTGVLGTPQRITAGIGNEDLSYWPAYGNGGVSGDVLFTVTEHPGKRMVYATPVSAF